MNSVQNEIIRTLERALSGHTGYHYGGLFPDHVHRIGSKFPIVLIEDGDQPEYRMESGRRVSYRYDLRLWLYLNKIDNRVYQLNTLTDEIIDSTLITLLNIREVFGAEVVSVEKGEAIEDRGDYFLPGVYQNLSVRRISFSIRIMDTLSS